MRNKRLANYHLAKENLLTMCWIKDVHRNLHGRLGGSCNLQMTLPQIVPEVRETAKDKLSNLFVSTGRLCSRHLEELAMILHEQIIAKSLWHKKLKFAVGKCSTLKISSCSDWAHTALLERLRIHGAQVAVTQAKLCFTLVRNGIWSHPISPSQRFGPKPPHRALLARLKRWGLGTRPIEITLQPLFKMFHFFEWYYCLQA